MVISLGAIELDEAAREVRCGGLRLPTDARTFDLLLYLIRHRDRIVSRHELLDQFWPALDVNDSVLTSAVGRLRKLLGGRADAGAVRAFSGRGYQFAAAVAEKRAATVAAPAAARFSWSLSGRAAEIRQLQRGVADLQGGVGSILLISGEVGLGKSRLAQEAIRFARSQGIEVLTAVCQANAAHFSLWQQWLQNYSNSRSAEQLKAEMGTGCPELAAMAPGLRAGMPEAPAAAQPGATDDARPRLFDAVRALLVRACAAHPLLLFVDDLHLADPSSLVLLQFIARALEGTPLMIAASYRDDERENPPGFAVALSALKARATLVELARLDEEQAGAVLEQLAGGPLPPAVRRAIVARADGNPLFIGECWRYLLQEQLLHHDGVGWVSRADPESIGLTGTAQAIIDRRLHHLSPHCREVVEVASVAGPELDLELLERLCGGAVFDAIEEALAARVLSPTRNTRDYRFAHPLIRERLYLQLSAATRAELHCRIGTMSEELYAGDSEAHLSALAHHFGACVAADTADKAAAYAQRAGERAYADFAYEEAVRQLSLAADVLERHRPELLGRRSQILIRLGDVQLQLGDRAAAAAFFQRANELVRSTPSGLAISTPTAMTRHQRLLAEMSHVINRPADASLRGDAAERRHNRAPLAAAALERARGTRNPDQLIAALDNRRRRIWAPEHRAERVPLTTEWLAVALAFGDIDMVQDARLHRIVDLLEATEIAEADVEIAAYCRAAELDSNSPFRWPAAYLQAMRAQLDGRFDEAEQRAEQAYGIGLRAQLDVAQGVYAGLMMMVRAAQGREAETATLVELTAARWPGLQSIQLSLVNVYYSSGRGEEAQRRFSPLAADDFAALRLSEIAPTEWADLMVALVRATIDLGSIRQAAILQELLEPHAGACLVLGMGFAFLGAYAGYLSGLAVATGQWKKAAAHFEHGLEIHTRMRAWPAVAFGNYDYGRSLLKRGRSHRRAALCLLERADKLARGMELNGMVTRIAAARGDG